MEKYNDKSVEIRRENARLGRRYFIVAIFLVFLAYILYSIALIQSPGMIISDGVIYGLLAFGCLVVGVVFGGLTIKYWLLSNDPEDKNIFNKPIPIFLVIGLVIIFLLFFYLAIKFY